MASTATQAASWSLAADVAYLLGDGFTVAETSPGGGQHDVLLIRPLEGFESATGPEVRLNRNGTATVQTTDNDLVPAFDARVWDDLASGRKGVRETSLMILRPLGLEATPTEGRVEVLAWRLLVAVLAQAALYRLDWSVVSAAIDTSGYATDAVQRDLLARFAAQLNVNGMTQASVRRYWLILSGPDPVACVDTEGRLLLPDSETVQSFVEEADDPSMAYSIATSLIAARLTVDLKRRDLDQARRPGLGLPCVLSGFNRKERFFVVTQAAGLSSHSEMHGPSIPLAAPFRGRLGKVIGREVPPHAYAAVDFHLSWLHAALAWWRGEARPGQPGGWLPTLDPEGANLVDGSQQDIDLLVCWVDEHGSNVIAVEAKAYGAWGNSPLASKVARLDAIRSASLDQDINLRLVLTSRQPPQKLTASPPPWAQAVGDPSAWAWVPLSAPGLRLATSRCDDAGNPSATGVHWRIKGPQGR